MLLAQSYYFHHLDQQKGLSNTFNAHFSVDREGYFWTSSRDGLNRYDGQEVRVFRPTWKGQAIDPNITSKVFHSSDKQRWFTSNGALHALTADQDSVLSWRFRAGEKSYYYAFHLERDSFLWVSAHDSLFVVPVHSQRPDTVVARHALQGFQLYPWQDSTGQVIGIVHPLIQSGAGLECIRYLPEGKIARDTFFRSPADSPGIVTSFFYLHVENDTTFWLNSPLGLIRFNPLRPDQYEVYKHDSTLSRVSYRAITPWTDRYIWVGSTREGLLLFDKEQKVFVGQEKILHVEGQLMGPLRISNMLVDQFDNLWVSVFDYGLLHTNLRNAKFSGVIPPAFLQERTLNIKGIVSLSDGSYVLAAANQGAYRVRTGPLGQSEITPLNLPCLEGEPINFVYQDSEAHVWLVGRKHVYRWHPATNSCVRKVEVPSFAYEIAEVVNGQMLLLEINRLVLFPKDADLLRTDTVRTSWNQSGFLSSMLYDPVHQLGFLMSGENELIVFAPDYPFRVVSRHTNAGFVNAIHSTPGSDTVWIASSTGLFIYHTQTHRLQKQRLPDQALNRSFTGLMRDGRGTFWLPSYQGVFSYHPGSGTLRQFTLSDGLLSLQYEENTAIFDQDSALVLGSDQGMVRFDPLTVTLNPSVPIIHVQTIAANGEPLEQSPGTRIVLPYQKNNVAFQFAAIEYSAPAENTLQTYLLNQQQDTLSANQSFMVDYPNLREGTYQIHAYAANSDGVWTTDPHVMSFTIRPPWYRTWWARLLGVVLFLAVVYAIYRFRVQQIARREAFKRQEAEFRQKEAEYKQLVAETETAVLRLQMNPHFIFNTMNSINSYILRRDMEQANDYLNRFARLMRMILELSEHPFTSLDEEVELLELYLQAEAMRLRKELHYSFEVDEQLDPEDTLLPTMLLQPFVENAIWHGISPRQEAGHIRIGFRQNESQLICTVEDDGVGRAASAKTSSGHTSKALDITQKRLDMLAQQEGGEAHLTIDDLHHPDGTPAGTRVTVTLPLIA